MDASADGKNTSTSRLDVFHIGLFVLVCVRVNRNKKTKRRQPGTNGGVAGGNGRGQGSNSNRVWGAVLKASTEEACLRVSKKFISSMPAETE